MDDLDPIMEAMRPFDHHEDGEDRTAVLVVRPWALADWDKEHDWHDQPGFTFAPLCPPHRRTQNERARELLRDPSC